MCSRSLQHVALVETDVSQNILPPSSDFLKMIISTFFTVKLLMVSLSIEGHYVG
jgi:hypothetical protein